MKPALLLIDMQQDYLSAPGLEPSAAQVTDSAARLLRECRKLAIPVIHVWTTVSRTSDNRMPHWKQSKRWLCVEDTAGHSPPAELRPLPTEAVVHKTFFSAFSTSQLSPLLASLEADTLLLAGVHGHACVRTTALDAYAAGYRVWVAEDAIASDDPVHASISRAYLARRAAEFLTVENMLASLNGGGATPASCAETLPAAFIDGETVASENCMEHRSPHCSGEVVWRVGMATPHQVYCAVAAARRAQESWSLVPSHERAQVFLRLADRLAEGALGDALGLRMALEIGKPVSEARGEIAATVTLLRDLAGQHVEVDETVRRRPLGVVAVITPWNNPLFIPIGKIAPALLSGNTVVWKPAPAASALALELMGYLHGAGCPPAVVNLLCGGISTANTLMAEAGIDGITLTGSSAAGYAAQAAAAMRRLPLQAELGGNNAAVVWSDCDVKAAAVRLAAGAFEQAGQRCTANRRNIVDARCYDAFLNALCEATVDLPWGCPFGERTRIGPLLSTAQVERVAAAVERSRAAGCKVIQPAGLSPPGELGAYYPPTIVCCDDASHDIVQQETFGPVLVVQRASDFTAAMELCNGVRQGLAAAFFGNAPGMQQAFLQYARAGILKLNCSTAGADPHLPFGGWKHSGIGPAEHGSSDQEFYGRVQTIYRLPE